MALIERTLPEEVWIQVFGFLTTREKHNVRTSCRYFKDVVDRHSCLWRDLSVVLSRFSSYNRQMWVTLRRRNVSSVVVRDGKKKNLKQLALSLPSLSTIAIENWSEESLELKQFSTLRRLAFYYSPCPLDISRALVPLSLQVTQLSVCNVKLRSPVVDFISTVSKMVHLTSLLYHHDGSQRIPLRAFHCLMNSLPKLKHLSWEMIAYKTLPEDFFNPTTVKMGSTECSQPAGLALSSLELLNYDTVVSHEALRRLCHLHSLSVYHLYSVPGPTCHLRTWLTVLQQLNTVSVHGGHPLVAYADCMPASVTRLTLCVDMTADDLVTLAGRVPDLRHLHLEPWGSAGLIGLIPHLFPQLRSLRMRHHNVPDRDFLSLYQLQYLETVEVLDPYYWPNRAVLDQVTYEPSPHLLDLIGQLQSLTSNRVHVITSKHQRDPLTCHCI
ncbi:uncharacterized protein ACJ7VT_003240 [Polymixia lowei]